MNTEEFKRKLSAILSADVEGYSRLMGDDELSTIETLKKYRNVISNLVQQFHGRVVDSPGDNLLAEFESVVDAVQCAVEIQKELKSQNDELQESRRMNFRIGVNLGDVVQEGERIYGDGINIAARIEALVKGGEICISRNAFDQVKDKLSFGYEYLGEHKVKNIKWPVRVYRVLMDPEDKGKLIGKTEKTSRKKKLLVAASITVILLCIIAGVLWNFFYLPTPVDIDPEGKMTFDLPKGPSIAVLPFNNMSGDPTQDYFCDGITENIISALSCVSQLFVVARNSTFAYKGKSVKIQQIGRELGTQYVIEGSIQKSDERIRIVVQLIDTKSGYHLWSERYDRELKEIFKLQDEITFEILKAMQISITDGEQIRNRFKGFTDLKAYMKGLKAVSYFNKGTKEDNELARKEILEIIELNPKIPVVYAFLGYTYITDMFLGACESPVFCFGQATKAVRKALYLDEDCSDAYVLAGEIFLLRKEHENAIAEFKHAIYLSPSNSDAYLLLGFALLCSDRPAESIEFMKKAIRLNPIPPSFYLSNLGSSYLFAKQYENAIEEYNRSIKINSDNIFAHLGLAAAYSNLGREKEARAAGLEVLKINLEFSLKKLEKTYPLKTQAQKKLYFDGLRKAGLK